MSVTFHRAFDETSDSSRALEDVIGAGASRVLTSGGMPSAAGAIEILRKLITQAAERITILPGGGLHAGNIAAVAQIPGIRELHTGLGTVLPYSDPHLAKFESAIRKILAAL
jgi:copper homeostasis protein